MARTISGGYEFDIPDIEYNEGALKKQIGADQSSMLVIRDGEGRKDDTIVAPGERVRLRENDIVTAIEPMEAA